MNPVFEIEAAKLPNESQSADYARRLAALSPIDSKESFNHFCREACRLWPANSPNESAETKKFRELLDRVEQGGDNITPTSWGGVVVTLHEHPKVEKYLVVRRGTYLALEKHAEKDERLEVIEGAGVVLWRPPDERRRLTLEVVRPGAQFHFAPGQEHCVIGTQDLLVFERSIDPKGMDQDLIFIYEPEAPRD